MSTIQEVEEAVRKLAPSELEAFRAWFAEFDAASWDEQFERDAAGGKLDAMADEAIRDHRQGRCNELPHDTVST